MLQLLDQRTGMSGGPCRSAVREGRGHAFCSGGESLREGSGYSAIV